MEDQQRTWMDIKIGIRDDQAEEFLDLLATDDEFRDRLAKEPARTLADYYIEIDESDFPDVVQLPPKQEVARFVDDLRKRSDEVSRGPGPRPPVLGGAILYAMLVLGPIQPPPPPPPPPMPPVES